MNNLKNNIRPYRISSGCAMRTWLVIDNCGVCRIFPSCNKVIHHMKHPLDSIADIVWTVI